MKRSSAQIVRLSGAAVFFLGVLFGVPTPSMAGEDTLPDFYYPGSLSFTLDPPDGLWQVAYEDEQGNVVVQEDRWRASGQTEPALAPGRYIVAFRAPGSHTAPDPMRVTVHGGASVAGNVTFPESTVYEKIEEIPPQVVRHGDTLRFQVTESGSLASVDPHPSVERDISFAGGVLTYRPTDEEREQFAMNFSAPGGAMHTVLVTPQGRLPAEASVIEYKGDFLPIESSAERKGYLTVLVEARTRSAQEAPLNLRADKKVRNVTISGPRVVFAAGHENELRSSFAYDQAQHPVDDIESLAIYAGQVVIRGPLHLPETDVTIYAREMRFEDEGGTAQLITTPLKAPGKVLNGVRGHDAGAVQLNVGSVYAPGNGVRLVLKGGDGQDPKEGSNGAPPDGGPPQFYDTFTDTFTVDCGFPIGKKSASALPARCVYYKVDENCLGTRQKWVRGTTAELRSGNTAEVNGVPGNGGSGGVLSCPFDLAAVADAGRGRAGPSQPMRFGSAGDQPYNAVKVTNNYNCVCDWNGWTVTKQDNFAGGDKPATSPLGPEPVSGEIQVALPPFAWLHPVAIRALLAFAKDAYLNGYPDETRALLEPYAEALKAYAERPAEIAADLDQLEDEIAALIHQLDGHLDFFGFPAGWVPMLSFEVTLALFQDEVKAAGDILYLSHYLTLEAAKAVNKAGALDRMRSELAKEIQSFQSRLDATKAKLNTLAIQARAIEREISEVRVSIQTREAELEAQASEQVRLKKALRVLGNVLPLIPVGQPVLGLAGAGFTAASKYNEQSALDSSIEATNLAHVFLEQHMDEQLQDFQTAMCTNPAECALKGAFVAQQKALQGLDAGIVAVNQVLKEAKTWESDVDKEIQILAAEDPRHKDLVKRVRALNAKKQRFAEDMVVAVQEALKLTAGINQNFLALDNLNRDTVKNSARIDQEAFAYIKEMGQRAKERLLKFQYYLVKAYHYRTVRPYHDLPGGDKVFQLKEVFDHFENQFFTNDFGQPNILDPAQSPSLVDIYSDQVREITAGIVDHLIAEPPEQTQTLNVELTPEELARLNGWDDSFGDNPEGDLRINLVDRGGLFDQRQENLRIFELKVKTMDVKPAPGTSAANVTAFVRHSGESLVSSKGNTLKFSHYRTLKQASIAWRGIYDKVQGTHTSPTLSAASDSLLETLLGGLEGQQVPDDLLLYSRPSAWADLVITKETLGGQEMVVNRLVLELKVDFSEKEAQAELEVSNLGLDGETLAPNVLLNRADGNLRGDGRGSFRRFFEPGESVTLTAQPVYGGYVFDRWVDRRGETASATPNLALNLPFGLSATVTRYQAVYRYSPGGGGPGDRFQRGDANADGQTDLTDAIVVLNALFLGGPAPTCDKSADTNDDGAVDISDPVGLLGFLYLGGLEPGAPFGACGTDETTDALTCGSYPICP